MTFTIVIGGMILGGCLGTWIGSMEDRGSDFPMAFMLYGLFGTCTGAVIGAMVAQVTS